ncbi:hypothetical protein ACX51_12595 [Lacticaseibacillus paracasei]|uniref:Uncharacterized protein n=1 Tax=Lacticaseibacillus paracasei TaxID=1597 RepID=A0ABD6VY06_LACPA|nr:hypothetical protein [Lacticaseibacillus paracasei]POE40586.1 hypothetical protein ACX51_12595 [Lacticaseibacillus paracasei]
MAALKNALKLVWYDKADPDQKKKAFNFSSIKEHIGDADLLKFQDLVKAMFPDYEFASVAVISNIDITPELAAQAEPAPDTSTTTPPADGTTPPADTGTPAATETPAEGGKA